jgi:uncharacterized protein (DUF1330 family)
MSLTLCVLIWAQPGAAQGLAAYEDRVLRLAGEHGCEVLQRARASGASASASAGAGAASTRGASGQPAEIHILRFPSAQAFDGFMTDPRRQLLAGERDEVAAATEVIEVELTGDAAWSPG